MLLYCYIQKQKISNPLDLISMHKDNLQNKPLAKEMVSLF